MDLVGTSCGKDGVGERGVGKECGKEGGKCGRCKKGGVGKEVILIKLQRFCL